MCLELLAEAGRRYQFHVRCRAFREGGKKIVGMPPRRPRGMKELPVFLYSEENFLVRKYRKCCLVSWQLTDRGIVIGIKQFFYYTGDMCKTIYFAKFRESRTLFTSSEKVGLITRHGSCAKHQTFDFSPQDQDKRPRPQVQRPRA